MRIGIVISLTLLGILSLAVWLGLTGLTTRYLISVDGCRSSYTHYYIRPSIRTAWECSHQTPCGVDEPLDRRNAAVRVMQCLCQKTPRPDARIVGLNQELITPIAPISVLNEGTLISASDPTGLCANARETLRL